MSLVEAGIVEPVIDQAAVDEFLAIGYVPPPRTGIEGVEHVEPGTAMFVNGRTRRVERWAPALFAPAEADRPVPLEELDAAFGRAADRHLVADVEVGLLLSSGVDSSLVLERLASEGRPPVCFTIGFPGQGDYDEARGARALARRFGAEHHVDYVDVGFQTAVESVAAAFDGPFADASAVATLAVARLAASRVKVVLSGTGGDDLFAGYYRHRAHLLHPLMRRVPAPLVRAMAGRSPQRGGERSSRGRLLASYATRLARASGGGLREQYLSLVGSGLSPAGLAAVTDAAEIGPVRERAADRLKLADQDEGAWLKHLRAFEARTYLPYDLLVKEDRATMAHSVESRVPLLDLELLEIAERMPAGQLISLRTGKRPLRALATRRIGKSSLAKRGFAMPLGSLLAGSWSDEAGDWLHESGSTLVDGRRVAAGHRSDSLEPLDIWALSTLIAWERRVAAAGWDARHPTGVQGG
jgi:asparagine synthase (glutamine-hydrolysing)